MGGIVQSVTPSMPGKLNSTCVLVLLFIFKLHFLNTTIVSLMYSVEYTYQGSYSGRLALGSPLEFWELNRNEHLGSIYFQSDIVSHYVPIITEPFSAQDRTLIISVKYRLVCKDVHQSSVGSKKWVWRSTLGAPPQTKILYETAYNTS